MVKNMTFTNLEIFNKANALLEVFQNDSDNFPVRVNFFLQKNLNKMIELAQDIEQERTNIVKKFGEPSPENPDQYAVPKDKIDEAQKELNDLFELEQEVSVNMLKLDWFDDVDMTSKQVAAISYMIDEEEE